MRSYTHIAGALLLFISFSYLINLNNLYLGLFVAGWISLFPDILDRLLGAHRGYGHSIFWLIPFILISFFNITVGAGLVMGIISHAVLDILTTHGSPLLYPLSKTNFVVLNEKKRIKTGTKQDKAVFITLIFLLIPILLFSTSYSNTDNNMFSQNFLSDALNGSNGNTHNSESGHIKTSPNLNIQLPRPVKNVTENITIKNIDENETNIMVINT